jgi:hypothetical protein
MTAKFTLALEASFNAAPLKAALGGETSHGREF